MSNIINKILEFQSSISKDENHRYKSWENCHEYFHKRRSEKSKKASNLDCLQLGFYLASWGMYRASSFLLDKSYEVHSPVISEILKSKYKNIWDINYCNITPKSDELNLIIELYSQLKKLYSSQIKSKNNQKKKKKVSDTLITKVLLGTLCCTPAYDRYFKEGCAKKKINPHSNFTKNSLIKIVKYYNLNKEEFELASTKIFNLRKIKYPAMKIVDMYLWQLGKPK